MQQPHKPDAFNDVLRNGPVMNSAEFKLHSLTVINESALLSKQARGQKISTFHNWKKKEKLEKKRSLSLYSYIKLSSEWFQFCLNGFWMRKHKASVILFPTSCFLQSLPIRHVARSLRCWWACRYSRCPARTLCRDLRNRSCNHSSLCWSSHEDHQSRHVFE